MKTLEPLMYVASTIILLLALQYLYFRTRQKRHLVLSNALQKYLRKSVSSYQDSTIPIPMYTQLIEETRKHPFKDVFLFGFHAPIGYDVNQVGGAVISYFLESGGYRIKLGQQEPSRRRIRVLHSRSRKRLVVTVRQIADTIDHRTSFCLEVALRC